MGRSEVKAGELLKHIADTLIHEQKSEYLDSYPANLTRGRRFVHSDRLLSTIGSNGTQLPTLLPSRYWAYESNLGFLDG